MTERYLLLFYKSEFERLKITPQRFGVALQHVAWMVEDMLSYAIQVPRSMRDNAKVNRWIGFVQGVFWKEGIYTVDQLREHITTAKVQAGQEMVKDYWAGPPEKKFEFVEGEPDATI